MVIIFTCYFTMVQYNKNKKNKNVKRAMKPCLGHFPLRSDVYQPYISDPTIRMNPYVYKRPAETLPPCSALLLPLPAASSRLHLRRFTPDGRTTPTSTAGLSRPPSPPTSTAAASLRIRSPHPPPHSALASSSPRG